MKPKLLFVDDDRYFTERYVTHLQEHFAVERIHYAGEVMSYLKDNVDLRLIILDIMMPTPKGVASSETYDGMDTGLWLLYELKGFLREHPLPILIYTNRNDTDVVKERVAEMGLREGTVLIRTKRTKVARDLPNLAKDLIDQFFSAEASSK